MRIAVIVLALVAIAPGAATADDQDDDDRTLLAHRRKFERCFHAELKATGPATPRTLKLVVRIAIDARGVVQRTRIERRTTPELDACMVTVLRKVRFPASTASRVVRYPFVFARS